MKAMAVETVILLIIGLIVLVAGILLVVRGQSAVGVSLSQSDLRNCCLNYCVTHDLDALCSVPKSSDKDTTSQSEPDGKVRMSWLCEQVGVNCGTFASQNCGCS